MRGTLSQEQCKTVEPTLREIAKKAESDFKPNDKFFENSQLAQIVERAAQQAFQNLKELSALAMLQAWNEQVVHFHRNRYWGFEPITKKPTQPKTEEQKIRREMFSYIWVLLQSTFVLKTAVYFFGLEYADKKEPMNLFLLLAAIATSFGSLTFFAYRKGNREARSEESDRE